MQLNERFPGFWGRFRFYLMGLAIGMIMLGFFQLAKKTEAQQREAEAERSLGEQQSVPDPLFPTLPDAERAKPAAGTTPASPGVAGGKAASPK